MRLPAPDPRHAAIALLLAQAACAGPAESDSRDEAAAPRDSADAAVLVEAEQAFADTVAARGWNAGVRAFAAPDAIVLSPGPVDALSSLGPDQPGGSPLQWWPSWAGIARSGDLGFTTGPFSIRGQGHQGNYFTVWRRQADGSWKWIFDAGVAVVDEAPPTRDAPVDRLPLAPREGGSEDAALEAAREADGEIARAALADAPAAILARLSDDARVNRALLPRGIGKESARATLAEHADSIQFEPIGAAASRAGDLAFTYGRARWTGEGGEAVGTYARIWQLRLEGWRLVFDQIVPHPVADQRDG